MQNANLWHSIKYSLVIHYSVHSVFNVYAINTLFITFVKHKSRMVFFFNFISSGLLKKFQPLASYFQNWRLFFVHDKYSSSPACSHAHYRQARLFFCVFIRMNSQTVQKKKNHNSYTNNAQTYKHIQLHTLDHVNLPQERHIQQTKTSSCILLKFLKKTVSCCHSELHGIRLGRYNVDISFFLFL